MFSGDLTKLSPALQELCLKRVEETKYFGNGIVNIALNYGSRQEIIKACNDLLKEGKTEIAHQTYDKNKAQYPIKNNMQTEADIIQQENKTLWFGIF